ncbi:MAG: aminodeoxychorismate synthase component I [Proteobacteria bacterium]|nr:aminodeoxychorismate synthase component I [Pseudomonadota bacterium]
MSARKDFEIKLNNNYRQKIELDEPFKDFASRFAHLEGTVVLMSGGDYDCARYHVMGILPWLTVSGYNQNLSVTTVEGTIQYDLNPFDVLRFILDKYKIDVTVKDIPFISGLMGYLSYDLKDSLEKLPRTSINDIQMPDVLFYAHSIVFVHDKSTNETDLIVSEQNKDKDNALKSFMQIFEGGVLRKHNAIYAGNLTSCFSKDLYVEAVNKIKEYIKAGDVYQVNLSQRFIADFTGDAFALFAMLYEKNPAPFFSFINGGKNLQIISTSPERFILQQETQVETRPIKGTRPRGITIAEDEKLKSELLKSSKDDAELSMIVDLLRNDLGKVCRAGSVEVSEHKRIEAYQNVYHLVSVVEGILKDDKDQVDLIKAVFPGGSITGCPKIRAMEIIDELEPCRRHIYTGAIGYISFHDTMDLSIAIRTISILSGKIVYSVGGGIVLDSNPQDEFDETLHKGRTIMDAFKSTKETSNINSVIWHNGMLKSSDDANVSACGEGFMYGYGFFETIRINKGNPAFLDEHILRFNDAWKYFFKDTAPDLTWEDIIRQVITENGLSNKTASIKIIAAKGGGGCLITNYDLLVIAKDYPGRIQLKTNKGLYLAFYDEPRQSPLASYKTLNYLYYYLAGQWAKENGADEALIVNPDGSLSETNTANIMVVYGKKIIRPLSPHVLPGIMSKAVRKLLLEWGYEFEDKLIFSNELFSADGVILTNSLMGAVPAIGLDGININSSFDLCEKINKILL